MNPMYYYIFIILFLWICIFIPTKKRQNMMRRKRIRDRRKGIVNMIPTEFINDYIGKTVTIFAEGGISGSRVEIVDVKDNWIKGKNKNQEFLINLDMVSSIQYIESKK